MVESRATIAISRPLDAVWDVLTDPEKSPIWSTPAIEERWLTPPPVGIGSRRRAVNRGFGGWRHDAEVTAYEPRRSWTMTSVSGPRFVATAVFGTVDAGTGVAFTWRSPRGAVLGCSGRVIAWISWRSSDRTWSD